MNTSIETNTVTATPNPSIGAVGGATGIAGAIGWGATVLGAKWGVPPEVVGGVLAGVATALGSIWSRFFGPSVQVNKPLT